MEPPLGKLDRDSLGPELFRAVSWLFYETTFFVHPKYYAQFRDSSWSWKWDEKTQSVQWYDSTIREWRDFGATVQVSVDAAYVAYVSRRMLE